jgi:hypothetical protein
VNVALVRNGIEPEELQASVRYRFRWPDPEKVDELKVEFCPIMRSRTNEEKSIQ